MQEKTLYLGDSSISYAFCSNFDTFTVFPTEKKFSNKNKFFGRIWEIVLYQSQSATNHVLFFGDN